MLQVVGKGHSSQHDETANNQISTWWIHYRP